MRHFKQNSQEKLEDKHYTIINYSRNAQILAAATRSRLSSKVCFNNRLNDVTSSDQPQHYYDKLG